MNKKLNDQETAAILNSLDEAIDQGPWEESNFLKVVGKNLKEIRENFRQELSAEQATPGQSLEHERRNLKAGEVEVYVSLYSTIGSDLKSWERILENISLQTISRPIYANEEDVEALVKSKENKRNEAYVIIQVSQNDIIPLPPDKMPIDKFGKPLLTLKDRALTPTSIRRFVHISGNYHFIKGSLTKI